MHDAATEMYVEEVQRLLQGADDAVTQIEARTPILSVMVLIRQGPVRARVSCRTGILSFTVLTSLGGDEVVFMDLVEQLSSTDAE